MLQLSQPLRKSGIAASTLTPQALTLAVAHAYSQTELGQVKAACLWDDRSVFASSRKGLWQIDVETGRSVYAQLLVERWHQLHRSTSCAATCMLA